LRHEAHPETLDAGAQMAGEKAVGGLTQSRGRPRAAIGDGDNPLMRWLPVGRPVSSAEPALMLGVVTLPAAVWSC
jgi:hypothetical protein